VEERLFAVGAEPGGVRVLVGGFPCDAARWSYFRDVVEEHWKPNAKAAVIVLHTSREVTRERFEKRGMVGNEFDKRFDEHEEKVEPIIKALRSDGLTVVELSVNHGRNAEEPVEMFGKMPAWIKAVEEDCDATVEALGAQSAP
jgi:hypothetical protein